MKSAFFMCASLVLSIGVAPQARAAEYSEQECRGTIRFLQDKYFLDQVREVPQYFKQSLISALKRLGLGPHVAGHFNLLLKEVHPLASKYEREFASKYLASANHSFAEKAIFSAILDKVVRKLGSYNYTSCRAGFVPARSDDPAETPFCKKTESGETNSPLNYTSIRLKKSWIALKDIWIPDHGFNKDEKVATYAYSDPKDYLFEVCRFDVFKVCYAMTAEQLFAQASEISVKDVFEKAYPAGRHRCSGYGYGETCDGEEMVKNESTDPYPLPTRLGEMATEHAQKMAPAECRKYPNLWIEAGAQADELRKKFEADLEAFATKGDSSGIAQP